MLIWKFAGLWLFACPGGIDVDDRSDRLALVASALAPCARVCAAIPSSLRACRRSRAQPSRRWATTTFITSTLSRPCSMTSRALVGLKATMGMRQPVTRGGTPQRSPGAAGSARPACAGGSPAQFASTRCPDSSRVPKHDTPLRERSPGAGSRNRTHDQRFTKPLLYQLSYAGLAGDFTRAGGAEATIGAQRSASTHCRKRSASNDARDSVADIG